jgi:hypothetical protein
MDLQLLNGQFGQFHETLFAGADLRDANLAGAWLRLADMRGADLRDAQLQGADLFAAQLRGADLRNASLIGADLSFAFLEGADLRGAHLEGANLRGAKLDGADVRHAHMWKARLSEASLQFGDFRGSDWDMIAVSDIEAIEAKAKEHKVAIGSHVFFLRWDSFAERLRPLKDQSGPCVIEDGTFVGRSLFDPDGWLAVWGVPAAFLDEPGLNQVRVDAPKGRNPAVGVRGAIRPIRTNDLFDVSRAKTAMAAWSWPRSRPLPLTS